MTSLLPCHKIDDIVLRDARERAREGALGERRPESVVGAGDPVRVERVGHLKILIGDGSDGIGGMGGPKVPARD